MTTYVLKAYRGKKILSHHGTVEEAATHFTELQNAGINPILHRADGLTLTNEECAAFYKAGATPAVPAESELRLKELRTRAVAGMNEVFAEAGAKPLDEQRGAGLAR